MTAQASLFDAPQAGLVRHSDPVTSLASARSLTPGRTERLILEQAPGHPDGFTDDEMAAGLWWAHGAYGPTVKTARSRLSKAGLLRDSGVTRASNRGRLQIVWELAS